jgi:hypothetical protein
LHIPAQKLKISTMRASSLLSFILLLISAISVIAAEATTQEILNKIELVITKTNKEKAEGDDPRFKNSTPYISEMISRLKQVVDKGDLNSVQQILSQMRSLIATEEIKQLEEALLEALQKSIIEKDQAFVTKVDSMIDQMVIASFAAKEVKELDSFIIELSHLAIRSDDYRSSELARRATEKARNAVNFATNWQDYLAQSKLGNLDAAAQKLRNLADNTSSYPFVARSEILGRITPLMAEKTNLSFDNSSPFSMEGKKLKDVAELRVKINEQVRKTPQLEGIKELQQALDELIRAQVQLKSGLIGQTFTYCTRQNYGPRSNDLLALRQELLLETLPLYLGVAVKYPTKKEENPAGYIMRVVQESRSNREWNITWKALEAYRQVAFGSVQVPDWLTSDISGYSCFIIAQNQETAGQYVDAIRFYRRVVTSTGENLPLKEASDRLAVLQKERPEDYQKAMTEPEPTAALVRPYPTPSNPTGR